MKQLVFESTNILSIVYGAEVSLCDGIELEVSAIDALLGVEESALSMHKIVFKLARVLGSKGGTHCTLTRQFIVLDVSLVRCFVLPRDCSVSTELVVLHCEMAVLTAIQIILILIKREIF